MKKKLLITVIVAMTGLIVAGCNVKTNVNVNINHDGATSDEAENMTGMANPIVEIFDDSEYEEQLGIKWDTSYLSDEVSRTIIGGKIAQASYTVMNTEGEEVEVVLRGTKDASCYENPIENLAGIYSQNLSEVITIDMPVDNGNVVFSSVKDEDNNMGIEYFEYDGVYYAVTYGTSLSQMTIGAINDSVLATIGAQSFNTSCAETGKVIRPLVSRIDVDNMQGEYRCRINSIENHKDGTVIGDFDIYTMDLYDTVDITTLEKGDIIIVREEEMLVNSIEAGNPIEISNFNNEEEGLRAVYIINGGIEEGGAEFIAHEGGTFRYFGMDDYATYTKAGNVKLPISEDALIVDHKHDFDGGEYTEEGVSIDVADFGQYFEDDMYEGVSYFTEYNTTIIVSDGVVTIITRNYTP